MKRKAHCADCKKELPTPDPAVSCGTGYARIGKSNRKVCYTCCGERDRKSMIKTGKATMYLSVISAEDGKRWEAANWPGTLKFYTGNRKISKHNIAGTRVDVWFNGPDGKNWHGVQYGSNTQILNCKRVNS